jgi:hypothetical protein
MKAGHPPEILVKPALSGFLIDVKMMGGKFTLSVAEGSPTCPARNEVKAGHLPLKQKCPALQGIFVLKDSIYWKPILSSVEVPFHFRIQF